MPGNDNYDEKLKNRCSSSSEGSFSNGNGNTVSFTKIYHAEEDDDHEDEMQKEKELSIDNIKEMTRQENTTRNMKSFKILYSTFPKA